MSQPMALLSVRDLRVHFKIASDSPWPWAAPRVLKAVDGVSFDVAPGETLGIVGESGCGKSTLARALLNLIPVTAGHIVWQGREMKGAPPSAWQDVRQNVQMIFQDPLASLNPRMTIGQIIAEPLRTHFPGSGTVKGSNFIVIVSPAFAMIKTFFSYPTKLFSALPLLPVPAVFFPQRTFLSSGIDSAVTSIDEDIFWNFLKSSESLLSPDL